MLYYSFQMFTNLLNSVDSNVQHCYKPPNSMLEVNRKIKSEDFSFTLRHPQPLSYICLQTICQVWNESGPANLPFPRDQFSFLNLLSCESDFDKLVKSIQSDVFWKRAYIEKFGRLYNEESSRNWKNMFMEKYYGDYLEKLHPKKYEPEKIQALVELCGPYIENLSLRSLIPNDIDTTSSPSREIINIMGGSNISRRSGIAELPDAIRDHISLHGPLSKLKNLTSLHLSFRQVNLGTSFRRDQFLFTNTDAKNLARGLRGCQALQILRITRSDLNCKRVKYVLRGLLDNTNLETLDFTSCKIKDAGCLTIAKFVVRRENIRTLTLTDNLIGSEGAEGIGYALTQSGCLVTTLSLRLNNKLGSEGVAHIAVALARGCNLINLNLSGCGITSGALEKPPAGVWSMSNKDNPPSCGQLLSKAIALSRTPLRSLDISVNNIGQENDNALSNAICLSSLLEINLKRSGMGQLAMAISESAVAANKLRRDSERGFRFRRSASRVLQANRIVKGMNMGGDPIVLAQKLSARPSLVSVTSEEGTFTVTPQPLPTEFGIIPSFKNPLSSSRASSITGPPTSRRSSYQILEQAKEARRSALVRRRSDGSLVNSKTGDFGRRITIFVSTDDPDSDEEL